MALGVIALYLFIALIATSLLRKHVGQKTWRAIHWASYAMWPLAVLHGITAGTDGNPSALDRLERDGWEVERWTERNLYFGGVQAVACDPASGELSGGGDPRRGGASVLVD